MLSIHLLLYFAYSWVIYLFYKGKKHGLKLGFEPVSQGTRSELPTVVVGCGTVAAVFEVIDSMEGTLFHTVYDD